MLRQFRQRIGAVVVLALVIGTGCAAQTDQSTPAATTGNPALSAAPQSPGSSQTPPDKPEAPPFSVRDVLVLQPSAAWTKDEGDELRWHHGFWVLSASGSTWQLGQTLEGLLPFGFDSSPLTINGSSHEYKGFLTAGADGTGGGGGGSVYWKLTVGGSRGWVSVTCSGDGASYDAVKSLCLSTLAPVSVTDLGDPN